jgi:integrase
MRKNASPRHKSSQIMGSLTKSRSPCPRLVFVTAFLFLVTSVSAILMISSVRAADSFYWIGTTGDWSDAANWGGTEPTGAADTYAYSPAEVHAMIKHCCDQSKLEWLGKVLTALAYTGCRIGELCSLRWSDVDLATNTLHVLDERSSAKKRKTGVVRTTNGKRSRKIPIHPELKKLLAKLPHHVDGYVFHSMQGKRLRTRNTLAEFIKKVITPLKARFTTPLGDIGFEDGRLHSFRHFFCSQAFLGGASEGEIRDWLGHAESKMVEHYRHLRNKESQRKMQNIDFLGSDDQEDRHKDIA